MKQPYNTALYYRLSRDDENFGDSVSIETQRTILQQFARDNQFHVVDEYIDDGWSGTNFDRPAFQQMMDDVDAGRINCIITKDLTEYNFNMLSQKYQMEQLELDEKIQKLKAALSESKQSVEDARKWIEIVKQYSEPTELTAELLNNMIDRIVVHEAVKYNNGFREQKIEIYYRFVGKID